MESNFSRKSFTPLQESKQTPRLSKSTFAHDAESPGPAGGAFAAVDAGNDRKMLAIRTARRRPNLADMTRGGSRLSYKSIIAGDFNNLRKGRLPGGRMYELDE